MGELKPLLVREELREALAAEAASEGLSLDALATQAVEAHSADADPSWLLKFLARNSDTPLLPGDELPPDYRPGK